jgi:hypothetical protein
MDKQQLSEFNFILIGDASGSMSTADVKGKTRWDYMQESFLHFSRELNNIDSDGIGLILFSGKTITAKDNCAPLDVQNLFTLTKPGSSTPLAQALEKALEMAKTSNKKVYIQVWTDGVPDDEKAVEDVIRKQANSQNADEDCTFQFVQVGYDKGATAYLQKLDNLTGAKFDIVNVVTIEEAEKFDDIVDLINAGIAG